MGRKSENSYPSADTTDGLSTYLREIQKFPMLEAEEEYTLAKHWQNTGDPNAARQLINSHLRLVAKIASGYRGYGLPLNDLISEGTIGIMQALKRFDPEKGFRLSTYASWWIKASIKEYVLRSWSLVRIGTTSAQKKLFFSLRKTKSQLKLMEEGQLSPEGVNKIAEELSVRPKDVVEMNRRMAGTDFSLNTPLSTEEGSGEWQDWLEDHALDQEMQLLQTDELSKRRELLEYGMEHLTPREYQILQRRHLQEKPDTLSDLAVYFGVSRERVRQIEMKAFEKIQRAIKRRANEIRVSI